MKSFESYFKKPAEFHTDLFNQLGRNPEAYKNHPLVEQFKLAYEAYRVGRRIERFLRAKGHTTRTEMYRKLRLDRVGMGPVEAALNKLYIDGKVYPASGTPGKGRTAVVLYWSGGNPTPEVSIDVLEDLNPSAQVVVDLISAIEKPFEPATIPNAILEEVESNPASQELAPVSNISLDKPIDVCEDQQVAEFRKTELVNEPKPVSEPKAQKIRRSALLEGLSS